MKSIKFLVLCLLGLIQFTKGDGGYKRICYFTNWSQYRQGDGKFTPADIESGLCSHLIYAFAKLEGNQLATIEANDEQRYTEFNDLKASNVGLKTSIAVGGWNAGSAPFSAMAASESNRASFIQSAIKFLRDHGFDGLDIDWEYPGARGGQPQDKENLGLLLKEMKEAFEIESSDTGDEQLFISIAVPAGKHNIDTGYDVKTIASNVDFINLMSYDFHGSWETVTGENSPLFARQSDTGGSAQLNTAWAANYWSSLGAPKTKIIVGMTFNGQTFTLTSPDNSGVGATSSGPGQAGQFTGQAGTMAYYEICKKLAVGGADHWDREQHVPYYVNGQLWVGYDNVRSISDKANWVKEQGYGGVMVWSLDSDDFRKSCPTSSRTYPLLRAINDALQGATQTDKPHSTDWQTTTTITQPTTQTADHTTDVKTPTKQPLKTLKQSDTTIKPSESTVIQFETTPKLSQSTLKPTQSTVRATQTTTLKPHQSTLQPSQSTLTQSQSTITSSQTTMKQSHSTFKQSQSTLMQSQSTLQSSQSTLQPSQSTLQLSQSTPKQSQSTMKPSQSTLRTSQSKLKQAETTLKNILEASTNSMSTNIVPVSNTESSVRVSHEHMMSPTIHDVEKKSTQQMKASTTINTPTDVTSMPYTNPLSQQTTLKSAQVDSSAATKLVTTTPTLSSPIAASLSPKLRISTVAALITTQSESIVNFARFFCSSMADGFHTDPSSCSGFYRCMSGRTFHFNCPAGTMFNPQITVCDWPHNVKCHLTSDDK